MTRLWSLSVPFLVRDLYSHSEIKKVGAKDAFRIRGRRTLAGGRKAMHKVAGEITLQQMLHEWAMHDLGHVRQIAELVRVRKHWQAAGRLGEFYQLRP
jgi:hypothetical protein